MSSVKHEYLAGEIHAMVGASRRHIRITGKIYRMLADAAEGDPCRVYISDMKLRVAEDLFYYPDVMAACEPEPDDPYTESETCLVVEVASPSTETTDRRRARGVQVELAPVPGQDLIPLRRLFRRLRRRQRGRLGHQVHRPGPHRGRARGRLLRGAGARRVALRAVPL